MPASRGWKVLGIAMVAEGLNGQRMLFGMKGVYSASIDFCEDPGIPFFGSNEALAVPPRRSIRLEAESDVGFMQYAEQTVAPPALPRGIYLPDMSFRALPAPEDSSNA